MQNLGNLEYDVQRKKKVLAVDIDVIESETLIKLNPLALQFFLCETLALCQNSLVHKETEVWRKTSFIVPGAFQSPWMPKVELTKLQVQ